MRLAEGAPQTVRRRGLARLAAALAAALSALSCMVGGAVLALCGVGFMPLSECAADRLGCLLLLLGGSLLMMLGVARKRTGEALLDGGGGVRFGKGRQ